MHVLRNAVAHGIEPPRRARGGRKAPTADSSCTPNSAAGWSRSRWSDDGRGVSPELLAARAEQEVLAGRHPRRDGFSTAERVSDAAGRGVGLDAVKLHVESLSGDLEVQSQPGAGTEVTLLLPVTLALMQALLFEWDGHPFALPMSSVGRVVWRSTDTTSLGGRPSLDIEGAGVPLSDLAG